MFIRTTTAAAFLALLAGPALADCQDEIATLEDTVIQAETGAASSPSDMPATEHQQEVLEEVEQSDEAAAAGTSAEATPSDAPASEHQRQALQEVPENQDQAVRLIDEAKQMAADGNEDGCMAKVEEARAMLGTMN